MQPTQTEPSARGPASWPLAGTQQPCRCLVPGGCGSRRTRLRASALDQARRAARLDDAERGMLSAAQQRNGLERRRVMARLHPTDRGRRGLSAAQERPGDAPVWHQKEQRVQAHILVCFLAYVLWKTLGMW